MKRLNANAAIAAKVELVSHFYVTVPEIIFLYASSFFFFFFFAGMGIGLYLRRKL